MTKLDELKVNLIVWKRTKSVSKATDICEWLVRELRIGGNGKTTDATPIEGKIENK